MTASELLDAARQMMRLALNSAQAGPAELAWPGRKPSGPLAGVESHTQWETVGAFSPFFKIERCRVHAIALAGRCGPIRKYMTQVCAAVGANCFGSGHSMGAVHMLFNRAFLDFLGKTWPAASRVKLCGRVEQFGIAANAAVAAFCLVVIVFTGKRPFSRCLARDLKSTRFGSFFSQQSFPFSIGFLNSWCHRLGFQKSRAERKVMNCS